MNVKRRDKGEARGSGIMTKMLGAFVIACLVVMAMLVGTASANGNVTSDGKNETAGYDETISINDLLTLLKLLTPGNYDLLLDMHEAGGYDLGDSTQRTQIKDSNLNFIVSGSSGQGIQVIKTASPTVVTPGTNVTFTIDIINTYDCLLKPVKVVDILAAGLTYVSDDSGGIESPERTITWNDITGGQGLAPRASTTITLVANIDADASGTLTDNVTVTGTPQEDFSDSDSAAVVALSPDISVTKTASPTEGAPCTDVTFTINVTNTGDFILNPVKVVDTLPAGMRYVPDASGGIESPERMITWNDIADGQGLAPGASKTITFVAHIDTGASGTLIDKVTAIGTPTPPLGYNVSDNATAVVVALAPLIDVTKTASPIVGTSGTNVTFTLEVTNTGDCILNPVKVVDTLPVGMSYVPDASGGIESPERMITWNDITDEQGLVPGASKTITFVAHIDTGASSPLIDNVTVWGTPPAGDVVTDYDTADVVVLAPLIDVTKTASPTVGAPCTNVTFTLEVTNIGDCILNPVKVVDTLPAGMSYVSDDFAGTESEGTITWDDITGGQGLAPGALKTITFVAHIDTGASSPLIDNVTVWGTPPAGDVVTDYDTADVAVSGIITPSPTIPPGTIPPGTMPPGTIPPTGEYPPTQVPVFTSIGIIALMGLLSVIAVMTLKRRK